MNDFDYRMKMNILRDAIKTLQMMASLVSDEDLKVMTDTIRTADACSFFLAPPLGFKQADQNLKDQQRLIDIHKDIRTFVKEVADGAQEIVPTP